MSVLIQAAIVFAVLSLSASDIHFPKDMRTDVQFPPIVKRSDSGLPDGHLRPLGYQKKPEARVKEYQELLAPREFWEQHVQHRVPLVYRQAVVKAPAFTKWQTDDYIREKYGDLDVLIEKKVESRDAQPQQMPLKEFLDSYEYEDWYVVSLLPDPMREEMMVPRSILCGTFRQHILESNLWISAGGTSSVLHYDADHNLHCLLSGRKDFILIHPKYADQLDLEEKRKFSGSGYSTMNMDMINIFTNPHIAKIPWTWATLRPGDCIFIPSDMGYMNVEVLRQGLLQVFREGNTTSLTAEIFSSMFEATVLDDGEEEMTEEDQKDMLEIFGLLDQKKKGFVSMEEIKDMDVSVLKNVARHLDSPHGPVKDHDHSHDEL
uniref:JmjC domain-containing protein n=1 Tax=Branchiostoma floridae TaxID=7739 RepID=C3YD88_BRAFL|eukprot:XP_002605689.1 hypothetical protein BRAFLDRAFT_121833 [Branchiostoma floridae]